MENSDPYVLLQRIQSPADLRKIPESQLPQLAQELRSFLIDSVSRTGGHLAANLGVIELTIALHYVFNTPDDRLVWDVGHQSYAHKILTGRRDKLGTIRRLGGLSGFPKRDESPYDTFGVGHSSTSISAALGMALSAQAQNSQRKVLAIIGDGALSAGMAFEALNHAGDLDANLLVILNDNEMSISPNVGGMSNYLARVLSSSLYSSVREGSKKVLQRMPPVWELARRAEEHVKGMVVPGTLFEELGFNYIGPVDGHDLETLITTVNNLKNLTGPQFLHVVTQKGMGYKPAEINPASFHGVGTFDKATGKSNGSKTTTPSYTQVFGQWLCDMAAAHQDLVAITPAMCEGSGMVEFARDYPKRFFDVGIAEQHSVTLAAGMACDGLKPVVAIYSTFLQRAYDQLIHDVALQNLPVMFAIDRAGLVGPDGATHAGCFDFSFLRCIPNMVVMAPADENECRQMLYSAYQHQGPTAVRYPRGCGPGVAVQNEMQALPIGKGFISRQGTNIAILAFGSMVADALSAGDSLDATVANMRFVKPLDRSLIDELASTHQYLITVEENAIAGGAGSAIAEYLSSQNNDIPIMHLGIQDKFLEQGSREELLAVCGLNSDGIIRAAKLFVTSQTCQNPPAQVKSQ